MYRQMLAAVVSVVILGGSALAQTLTPPPTGQNQPAQPASPTPASANSAFPMEPNARIRVSTTGEPAAPLTGKLTAVDGESLVLLDEATNGERRVPLSDVGRVEEWKTHRHTLVGTVLGGVAGAAVGALMARPPTCENRGHCIDLFPSWTEMEKAAKIGGGFLVGAALGAVVGHRVTQGNWQDVPRRRTTTLFVAPVPRGVAVGGQFQF